MTDDAPVVIPGSVLVHPDDRIDDRRACRIMARDTTLLDEWPWFRFTGDPRKVPPRGSDLRGWQKQSLASVGAVFGV